jgi:hypothetical protein
VPGWPVPCGLATAFPCATALCGQSLRLRCIGIRPLFLPSSEETQLDASRKRVPLTDWAWLGERARRATRAAPASRSRSCWMARSPHSAVRRQLLPDAVIDELGWSVYGRKPFAGWLPGVLVGTFNRISGPGGTGMSVATCRALEPPGSAAARLAPSERLTDVPGYFSWTLPLANSRLFRARAVALHREAARPDRRLAPCRAPAYRRS